MTDSLEAARDQYRRRAWQDAFHSLSVVDEQAPLSADDLERLGFSAYLIGRDSDFFKAIDRAHRAHKEAGEAARAARCAFWLGLRLLLRGEAGPATGWLARAQRLVERAPPASVEQGYLALADAEQKLASGRADEAEVAAASAVDVGERHEDADLAACARHVKGRAHVEQGHVHSGLALLDEAMVAVTAGEVSEILTGLIYCSVIEACQSIYEWRRAREWTSALARWCDEQPQFITFTGTCLVHRAEVLLIQGAWSESLAEAEQACERAHAAARPPPAGALYQQGEVHRLRGHFTEAEEAYRRASERGLEPQPGLSLLRIAQGRASTALTSMRRLVRATTERHARARLLPAYVDILLACGCVDDASAVVVELQGDEQTVHGGVVSALGAHARGAVELARRDADSAVTWLRRAEEVWREVEAPYLAARARELVGAACQSLGDADGWRLELNAARATYERLGAAPDMARVEGLASKARSRPAHGMTSRELEVLSHLASGKTNKCIANELGLSGKTVDRHVSNIFVKIGVSSRAAATAYAYEHELIGRAQARHG